MRCIVVPRWPDGYLGNGVRLLPTQCLTKPWELEQVLPPLECDWASPTELEDLRVAALTLSCQHYEPRNVMVRGSPWIHAQRSNFKAQMWRDSNLQMEPCMHHPGCTTYRAKGRAWSLEELSRLGMEWAVDAWQPIHVLHTLPTEQEVANVFELAPWQDLYTSDPMLDCEFKLARYRRNVADGQQKPLESRDYNAPPACTTDSRAYLEALRSGTATPAVPPPNRAPTVFTPYAAAAGLSAQLQYMQVGDTVLVRGERAVCTGFELGDPTFHRTSIALGFEDPCVSLCGRVYFQEPRVFKMRGSDPYWRWNWGGWHTACWLVVYALQELPDRATREA